MKRKPRFHGLDEKLDYCLRIEPEEKVYYAKGGSLVRDGIEIRLDTLLISELLLLTANE